MEERRRFARLQTKEKALLNKTAAESTEGAILDISPGGMKIVLQSAAEIGTPISGQFKILPELGPFYVKGEVIWTKAREYGAFDVGIKFNQVSTIPF